MYEVANVRQIPGEAKRRWFCSAEFDLIVWCSEAGDILGFELCYDKLRGEHAIVWNETIGFRHMAVDDGEQRPGKHKSSPILVADGYFDVGRIYQRLQATSEQLPQEIASFVLARLKQHPHFPSALP